MNPAQTIVPVNQTTSVMPGRRVASVAPAPQISWRVLFFPIIFFELYLNFTVLWFAIGPCEWVVEHPLKLYGFLILAHLALWLGYLGAIRRQPMGYHGPISPETLAKVSILVVLAWAGPQFYLTRTDIRGIGDVIAAVVSGFSNLSAAYADKFNYASPWQSIEGLWISRLHLPFVVFQAIYFPLCVVYWGRLNWAWKGGFLVALLLDVAKWIMIGTTKGIADMSVTLPWLLLIANPSLLSRLTLKKAIVYGGVTMVCFLALFGFFTRAKIGDDVESLSDISYDPTSSLHSRPGYLLIAPLTSWQQHGVVQLSGYLTQGYYALGMCLDEPFVWCYGLGHGYFTAEASRRIFPQDYILNRTYPARIEDSQGYEMWIHWHTIYPWIASDVTFPGTLVVVFLIGWAFALLWLDGIRGENPFAIGFLYLFIRLLYYFPANSQVTGFADQAIPFWLLLTAWLLTRGSRGGTIHAHPSFAAK
jgi:hypothetical protein